MSTYTATVSWARGAQPFLDKRYSRRHVLRFDGGVEVAGSSSPSVVPLPYSAAEAIDPEEMFVASLSSCHLLWFLDIACRAGFCVDSYEDEAEGTMAKDAAGRLVITTVTLRPLCRFSGAKIPTDEELHALHERAHEECFIANSVKSEVRCVPRTA